MYFLDPVVAAHWSAIEQIINVLIHDFSHHAGATLSLYYQCHPNFRPFCYKYWNTLSDESKTCQTVNLAYLFFTVQLTMVSYFVAYTWYKGENILKTVESQTHVAAPFFEAVRHS